LLAKEGNVKKGALFIIKTKILSNTPPGIAKFGQKTFRSEWNLKQERGDAKFAESGGPRSRKIELAFPLSKNIRPRQGDNNRA